MHRYQEDVYHGQDGDTKMTKKSRNRLMILVILMVIILLVALTAIELSTRISDIPFDTLFATADALH